jgi:hypothetical protein
VLQRVRRTGVTIRGLVGSDQVIHLCGNHRRDRIWDDDHAQTVGQGFPQDVSAGRGKGGSGQEGGKAGCREKKTGEQGSHISDPHVCIDVPGSGKVPPAALCAVPAVSLEAAWRYNLHHAKEREPEGDAG